MRSGTSQPGLPSLRGSFHAQEHAMTADTTTPLEQVNTALSQLKEMRHY